MLLSQVPKKPPAHKRRSPAEPSKEKEEDGGQAETKAIRRR
jgi:hypothetical protein